MGDRLSGRTQPMTPGRGDPWSPSLSPEVIGHRLLGRTGYGEKHRMHQGANAKNFFHLLRLVVINILGVGTFVHILVTALTFTTQ